MLLFRTERNHKQIKIVLELDMVSRIHNPSTWGQEQENRELKEASGPQSALEASLCDMRNGL